MALRNSHRNAVEIAEETLWFIEQKRAGHSLRQISAMSEVALGTRYSYEAVRTRVRDELASRITGPVEELREEEVERLDYYLTKLSAKIDEGDVAAIAQAVRISESRRKLLGTDTPVRADISIQLVDPATTPLGELIAQRVREDLAIEAEIMQEIEGSS